jgi:hypothetical protein
LAKLAGAFIMGNVGVALFERAAMMLEEAA